MVKGGRMTLEEGIYEVYHSFSAIDAVTAFRDKYGYLPDDVQRQGDVMLAGPVRKMEDYLTDQEINKLVAGTLKDEYE
jgi:hypothetical protein